MPPKDVGLILQMLRDFREENKEKHEEIIEHQKETNGKVACLKKNQILLRGILIGAGIVLFVLGFMPQRIYELFKGLF